MNGNSVLQRLTTALADRYRLERELGAGGMATVYLAHDLKHDRDVAIKVLHPDLGAALGAERFLSEIKTTARLQHPHILPLLDSGEIDGLLFYVMPLVKGETLRTRLQREGQLPVADALRIAREVADALAEAHAVGIVHRDIKPENILLQGAHALVADFGISLAVQQAGGARMTQTGLSLGTPQYMAPEQAMGDKAVDHRVDIYALGAVTYEMLTGEPPHTGTNPQAIVAKLLTEPVRPATVLRPATPEYVEQALQTALERLPADRFATVAEFGEALRGGTGARVVTSGARHSATVASAAGRRRGWIVAGVTLAAFVAAGGWLLGRQSSRAIPLADNVTRFSLDLRGRERVAYDLGNVFALSHDGSTIVYLATEKGQQAQLYRRRFDELDAHPIPGSAGASNPIFSPDDKWLAFTSGAQVVKLAVEGGQPIVLGTMSGLTGRGIAWLDDGTLVFASIAGQSLYAVPQNGGAIRPLFDSPAGSGLRWPIRIPGSDKVLFVRYYQNMDSTEVFLGSPATGKATPVAGSLYAPVGVLDRYLVYLSRAGEIMATPFDLAGSRLTGTPIRIANGVMMNVGAALGFATLSDHGDLVYQDREQASQLMYVTPQGVARPAMPDTGALAEPRLSPDGKRIALVREMGMAGGIWMLERATGILTRMTPQEIGVTRDRPEWTPDGSRVMYRYRGSREGGFRGSIVGATDSESPLRTPNFSALNEIAIAPDGQTVVARVSGARAGNQNLVWWTLSDTTSHALTQGADFNSGPRFSPDGKWLAFSSQSTGRREVYVMPFPGPGPRVQVSKDGGGPPVWARDGRTLYYARGSTMMAASLSIGSSVQVTATKELFAGDYLVEEILHATYDVMPDGTFLLIHPVKEARTVVIRNFGAEIRHQIAKQGGK